MDLKSSTVHRNLKAKFKVLGMDAFDLLFVMILASVMNLIFGQTFLKNYLVFGLPAIILIILFITKRNREEKYLIHQIKRWFNSGQFSAGQSSLDEIRIRNLIYVKKSK